MDSEYFILESGKKQGPFTAQELMDRPLEPSDLVVLPLQTQAVAAHDLPQFKDYFKSEGIYFPTPENTKFYILRLPAFIIDYLLISIVLSIFIGIFFPVYVNHLQTAILPGLLDSTKMEAVFFKYRDEIIISQVVLFVVMAIYNAYCESTRLQASFGKYLMGLAVVDELGYGITFLQALIRNMGKGVYEGLRLFLIGPLAYIFYLKMIWSVSHQCLHDQVSGCFIVKKNK